MTRMTTTQTQNPGGDEHSDTIQKEIEDAPDMLANLVGPRLEAAKETLEKGYRAT